MEGVDFSRRLAGGEAAIGEDAGDADSVAALDVKTAVVGLLRGERRSALGVEGEPLGRILGGSECASAIEIAVSASASALSLFGGEALITTFSPKSDGEVGLGNR